MHDRMPAFLSDDSLEAWLGWASSRQASDLQESGAVDDAPGALGHSGALGASGFSSVASRTDTSCSSALTDKSVAQNSSSALIGSLKRRIAYAC